MGTRAFALLRKWPLAMRPHLQLDEVFPAIAPVIIQKNASDCGCNVIVHSCSANLGKWWKGGIYTYIYICELIYPYIYVYIYIYMPVTSFGGLFWGSKMAGNSRK